MYIAHGRRLPLTCMYLHNIPILSQNQESKTKNNTHTAATHSRENILTKKSEEWEKIHLIFKCYEWAWKDGKRLFHRKENFIEYWARVAHIWWVSMMIFDHFERWIRSKLFDRDSRVLNVASWGLFNGSLWKIYCLRYFL